MAIYVPKINPFKLFFSKCINITYALKNIKYKHSFKKKKLTYDDIIRIEYDCIETPEMIFEDMCIDKNIENENDFNMILKALKENDVLNWKRNYRANFEYYDGCWWNIKITFKLITTRICISLILILSKNIFFSTLLT